MSGSKNIAPEELRDEIYRVVLHHRGNREIADAALAAIEARYPGCWELLEASRKGTGGGAAWPTGTGEIGSGGGRP